MRPVPFDQQIDRQVNRREQTVTSIFGDTISGSASMSRFIVRFMKDVLGENGREKEVCQCTLEVDATNKAEASKTAKQKFCEIQGLSRWSDHADRVEVKEGDFPS
jgi:hypothetical protein